MIDRRPSQTSAPAMSERLSAAPPLLSFPAPVTDRDPRRVRSERAGRIAEWLAALLFLVRGYRIIARRYRCSGGEIDLIAVRGRRLAFVEVKLRAQRTGAEAAISARQCRRLHDAAEIWVARHRRYRDHDYGFDAVFVPRRGWPRLAHDHLQPAIGRRY